MHHAGRTRVLAVLSIATVSLALLAGCGDSNSASPTSPGGPPTTGNVAGTWSGTFNLNDFDTCDVSGLAVQATFEQNGSMVHGTLSTASNPCAPQPLTFAGAIQGNQLEGKTSVNGIETFGTVKGTLSGGQVEMKLGVNQFGYATQGEMHLHR